MPSAPVLYRTALYDVLPDGTLIDLPFNIINTSLGQMIELEPVPFQISGDGNDPDVDPFDRSWNDRRQFAQVQSFDLLNVSLPAVVQQSFRT